MPIPECAHAVVSGYWRVRGCTGRGEASGSREAVRMVRVVLKSLSLSLDRSPYYCAPYCNILHGHCTCTSSGFWNGCTITSKLCFPHA